MSERLPMTCEITQSQLMAFLDGELPGEMAVRIEAHLQTCPQCAEARDSLAALSETLSAWAVPAPDILSSVMQAVTADELAQLRNEVRELRTEIRLLREEVAAQSRPALPRWFPEPTSNYARMEENDPWNLVRS